MRLVQLKTVGGERAVVVSDPSGARRVKGVENVYALAIEAIAEGETLTQIVQAHGLGEAVDLDAALAESRVLAPIDHPDPAHMQLTGTGLTHLGSADARDRMHRSTAQAEGLTDSMKMFRMGLEGGKPAAGEVGVQPEWFYKGDGSSVIAPEASFQSPNFALDGGEEPEIAGVYVIAPDGTPCRLGFTLGNEFSDHVTERQNYLFLAHSKLRNASFGPELRLGELPGDVRGASRIRRAGRVIWEKPFLSGEENMSHTIANLEHHHFKYAQFRRPGDVHVHFFGTATLSFNDGIKAEPGDVFEIEVEAFGRPLRNALAVAPALQAVVRAL
ncbi:AraD1 family protein [Caulobacter sp. S45]|uniref:AraD1 family protein n=1 Tax=Caulobacter sp. S45 TaxID=1641861 RepID=UPI00131BCA74|nr:AraD1 family protein [Caulobacter sp. S45]